MTKVTVYAKEIHVLPIVVEVENPSDWKSAQAKAMDLYNLQADNIPFDKLEYSHTLPSEEWRVEIIKL